MTRYVITLTEDELLLLQGAVRRAWKAETGADYSHRLQELLWTVSTSRPKGRVEQVAA